MHAPLFVMQPSGVNRFRKIEWLFIHVMEQFTINYSYILTCCLFKYFQPVVKTKRLKFSSFKFLLFQLKMPSFSLEAEFFH